MSGELGIFAGVPLVLGIVGGLALVGRPASYRAGLWVLAVSAACLVALVLAVIFI